MKQDYFLSEQDEIFSKIKNAKKRINVTIESKKLKNRIFSFALLVLCLLSVFLINNPTKVSATIVEPTTNFYVNDYANILSSETEQYIMNTNVELQQKTGAQIVVVTVASLDGMSIEEYANELFNNWGIGDETKDNGLLLLCSYGDREFRVEVGYGLEGILPDGKTGRLQDEYIIPYLKENNFDEGIKNGYSAFLQEVASEYDVTITGSQNATQVANSQSALIDIIVSFASYIIPILIILLIFKGRGRTIYLLWRRRFPRRRWLPRWWRIFWWRRSLWWRRKQQKFLNAAVFLSSLHVLI